MGRRIFLLESDESLCHLLKPLLEGRGHLVTQELSGKKALALMQESLPDMVIVGEQLSDIDGIALIIKIREKYQDLLLVFISEIWRDTEFYQQLTKELQVHQIFNRPIKSNLFATQIESLWADQSAGLLAGAKNKLPVSALAGAEIPLPGETAKIALNIPKPYSFGAPLSMETVADATLSGFRQKFSKSATVRVKQITEILLPIIRQDPDMAALTEARRLAHNLKGTARSCGFNELGALSERMESGLKDLLEDSELNPGLIWVTLDDILASMKAESESLRLQFMDYIPSPEELKAEKRNSAMASVLVVSQDSMPFTPEKIKGGIALELIAAQTAAEALEKAAQYQFDAALIEISLEQKESAFQLARELRSLVGYEDLPLGFISANEEEDRAEAAHAGASLFLAKPYTKEELHKTLQHLIAIREGVRSKIVLVDDDSDFTDLVSAALGNEGMLVRALNDPSNVIELLDEFNPDLMLVDVMMPKILGFDVCKQIRATGRWQDLPIIFLTAQTDLAARLGAFDAGGDDYLPKPVLNVELLKRVKIRLERARMSKERQDRDLLTGLLLRRAFIDYITALISECHRHQQVFSMCLLDIDHFKLINDQYGHMAGDRVLAYIGKLLKKRFRVEDLRGRWGGEEFVLAFRYERKETMQKALQRVLEELTKVEFKGDHDESFFVSFSAGLVDYPADGKTIPDLIRNADRRLYLAKKNGRKQILIDG